ncbi:ATP-binding protein [Heyndrickxia sporothermodurans]|uniref:ATP-binding protein n=1 Tax=Heyndrickxia sporothermodurans TaxID=46224 RepID=UPI002E20FD83|nr:ATP-binding protein [Heyndrickxia sporothermodurans]MED3700149.1 ATP-binding protein [Heyndrickxia sporothermodurans]MED3779712.1 ATP-binding protein [Heyndrickxia sporothermodurans]
MRNLGKTNDMVVLKGDFEKGVYKEQLLSEYTNNPFIEALPPIFNEDDVLERFMVTPRISDQDKLSETNIRYHVLKRVKNFIQPLPIHFEVERRLSTLIRRGYLARNPLDRTFLERVRVLHELREEEETAHKYIDERLNYIRSTADSLSIIGISGIGKTTAIERLLLMYPQVIKHEEYKGQPFNRTQIVWLKIDCPYDGSLSTLCKSFFKAIDDLLETRYLEKFGYLNRVTSTMLLHMTSLASMYGIGVLVIDEIQHLLHSKNDQEEMLNFFVTLSNTVGIPTVLIGTSKAQKLFKGNFRQARRAASEAVIWDRMAEDSEEWEFFLETLWELQCLKTQSKLTEEMKKAFYYECQGITSVAVNLFILAQERALFDEDNPNEIITPKVLKKTAKDDMQMIQPMMTAIQKNNLAEMTKYEDIMINLDEIMLNHKRNTEVTGRIQEAFRERQNTIQYKRQDTIETLSVEVVALGIFDSLKDNDIKKLVQKIVGENPLDIDFHQLKSDVIQQAIALNQQKKEQKDKPKVKNAEVLPLLTLRKRALDKKQHPHELLKANGYIKNPLKEFY